MNRRREPTATSAFGVGRRENHDASAFYARFAPPDVDVESEPSPPGEVDLLVCGDARAMVDVKDGSVALVVTSPPYFAGKEYENALGEGHVPGSYVDYLQMLEEVFAECVRALEPGGRIAVNVANLGRKPYRSLSADVIGILQDRLRLLLRGEIVWRKARGATGSCAWGSYAKATNPVVRDLTERVVVASKGRFDRSGSAADRERAGRPHRSTITADEFLEATLDVWDLPAESATRVGHPAPFPVELPERLIDLYTFAGDLVLDPFVGAGTTAVAAVRTGRHYVGYDTDADYLTTAQERIDAVAPADRPASRSKAVDDARGLLEAAGFRVGDEPAKVGPGIEVAMAATDGRRRRWHVEVVGGHTAAPSGLRRTDEVWRILGRAAVMHRAHGVKRLLVLTTDLPPERSAAATALASQRGETYVDALGLGDPATPARLAALATA